MSEALRVFTVYANPKDFPGKIVVRGARSSTDGVRMDERPIYVGEKLEAARAAIQRVRPGAFRLERDEKDDPVIVEVWL